MLLNMIQLDKLNMKKEFLTLLFGMMFCFAYAQKSDDIKGVWLSENKDGKIEIYEQNGKYFGKLIWLKNEFEKDGKTPRTDVNNPDEKLRNQPLKGLVVLKNLIFEDGQWNSGQIYDNKTGKTYNCKAKLEGNSLILRGFVGVSLFGRSTTWTPVR